jgi:hypothetical protein
MRGILTKTLPVLAALTLSAAASVSAQPTAPTPAEKFTQTRVALPTLVEQGLEYDSVIFAGKRCKLFTVAEQNYWNQLWKLSSDTVLSPHDQQLFAEEKSSKQSADKVEARVSYFRKAGCESPELVAKIRDMKKRMRLQGFALKQVIEANGAAITDLYNEPAE